MKERERESEEAKLLLECTFVSMTVVYMRKVRNLNPKRNRVYIYIYIYIQQGKWDSMNNKGNGTQTQ